MEIDGDVDFIDIQSKKLLKLMQNKEHKKISIDNLKIRNDELGLLSKSLDDMTLEKISDKLGVPFNVSRDNIFEIFERNIVG